MTHLCKKGKKECLGLVEATGVFILLLASILLLLDVRLLVPSVNHRSSLPRAPRTPSNLNSTLSHPKHYYLKAEAVGVARDTCTL